MDFEKNIFLSPQKYQKMKLTITLLSLFLFNFLSYSQDLFYSSINLDVVGAVNQDGSGTPVALDHPGGL